MKSRLIIDRNFTVGESGGDLFGGFVEHIGRCVYNGISEPGHPAADGQGFRRDVIELVKELGMPLTRYPGGNFVSGFNWKDAIGPLASRPVRPDYAWRALEPNTFGIDEFIRWCRLAETEPLYAVNLSTDTPKSAQELVEYCNHPSGTAWSDLRRRNGAQAPYGIRYWCLGNEVDGDWQIGHMTATEYGRIAHETAKMMRMADGGIRLCACGSSTAGMPTFGAWDQEVMRHVFHDVDYLSIHKYFGNREKDYRRFFASAEELDWMIESAAACCDAVAAEKKSRRRIMIALDEWNVWYRGNTIVPPDAGLVCGRALNEETYDMADVLVVGSAMLSMLDHADRLRLGCLAQTVNVIAPIMTRNGGGAWRQTIFYPFRETSRYGRGTVMRSVTESPAYQIRDTAGPTSINFLRAAAVWRREAGEITLFAVNRADEAMEFEAVLGGFAAESVVAAEEIFHDSLTAVNREDDEAVAPAEMDGGRYALADGGFRAKLRPYSWNMFRIKVLDHD